MEERQVIAAIENEERRAYGGYLGELSYERAENLDYYLGEPFGNESPNRSQVVLTDVADTVEWIMPSLMRVFTSGEKIVNFEPVGPEDEQLAKQETDYTNFVVTQKNPIFESFYTWFKDALISKNGYMKFWYEEKIEVNTEQYEGLSDEEFYLLEQDPYIEFVEHTERAQEVVYPTPNGPMAEMVALHDVTVKKTTTCNVVRYKPVPPEEMLVSVNITTVGLTDVDFIQHRTEMTLSEIRQMGFDIPDNIQGDDQDDEYEDYVRDQYGEEDYNEDAVDSSMRRVTFKETYVKLDMDNDGIAELHKICIVGKTILEDVEFDHIPFAAISPILMPHRHIGRALADLVKDLQYIRSTVIRQALDNMYLTNNVRMAVNKNTVNLDDALTDRPGSLIRVDGIPGQDIMPVQVGNMGSSAYTMLEYLEGIKETRTGITKYNQGLDANSLNKTATGISQIMGAAQQRIELIARTFAETGVKDLFMGIHALILKHFTKEEKIKLRNEWVPVDPRQWKTRTDLTISVGMGTGNKEQMLAHLANIFQSQMQAMPIGVVNPKNIYNTLVKMAENSGFKMPEEFFTEPNPQEQQMQQQQMMQQQQQMMQAQMQAEQQKLQAQMQLKREEMMGELEIKREEMLAEIQLKREEAMADIQLDREKASAQIQTDRLKVMNE